MYFLNVFFLEKYIKNHNFNNKKLVIQICFLLSATGSPTATLLRLNSDYLPYYHNLNFNINY